MESLWLSGRASERGIRRSEVRFLTGTQNSFFVPRLWQDEKNIFVYFFTELKTYHLPNFFSTNITPSTLLILAVFRTRVRWTSQLTSLTVASLWLSGRASERGIRWFEVRFLMGTQNVFLVPRSWQDQITIFISLPSSKLTISLISNIYYLRSKNLERCEVT